MNTNIIAKHWMRRAGGSILTTCLAAFFALNLPPAFAQSAVLHIHESGGAAALTQALTDVAEPGTIYVHSGIYDLGATTNSFLTITKAVTLVGFDDGTGKPVIKGARPSGSPGLLLVNAPNKAVVLENLGLLFTGTRTTGSVDTALSVQGSNSFTLRNCTITAAYFDGTNNQGLYSALSIAGPPQSEFPANSSYPARNNVQGEIKIQNSTLTSWITSIGIGFFGPVSLDKVELSNCTLNVLGSTQAGGWARGNFGLLMTQYPAYMNEANRSSLIEATHARTNTIIRNNTFTAPNTIWLFYLKGVQRIEKNRLNSHGSWYTGGKYYQAAIAAWGYPHNVSDPTTYSEAIIKDNVIDLQVPPFPIAPMAFFPRQTMENTFPPMAIWLGVSGRIFYPSALTGHHAKATITGNVISSLAFSSSSPLNPPDYGLYLRSEMKNCVIAGNNLAGGKLVDPIDGRIKSFEPFTAKVAQLYVGPEAHDNYFGPAARHE